MALSGQQLKFAKAFTEDGPSAGNVGKAAVEAGYPVEGAAEHGLMLLKDPQIAEYIRLENRSAADKLGITVKWLLQTFRENYEKCMQPKLVKDAKGKQMFYTDPETGVQFAMCFMYDAKSAKGFGEMLAKHLKILTDRVEVDNPSKRNAFQAQPTTAEEAARRYQQYMASQK